MSEQDDDLNDANLFRTAVVIAPFWKPEFKNELRLEGEEALRFFDAAGSGWIREEFSKNESEL